MSFNIIIAELFNHIHELNGDDYKGFIIALFTLAAGLSRPFSGKITDTLGRVPVMVFGGLVAGGISLLYPILTSLSAFLWLRFFHGFSTGFAPTGLTSYVADIVPSDRRGEAMGVIGFFSSIGMALGPSLGSFIAWQWGTNPMFMVSGAVGVLSAVLMWGMKETVPNHGIRHTIREIKNIDRHDFFEPAVLLPTAVYFVYAISYGAVLTIIPDTSQYIYSHTHQSWLDVLPHNWSSIMLHNKGLFFFFSVGSSTMVRILAGTISDKFGRLWPILGGMVLLLLALLGMANIQSIESLLGCAILYGTAVGFISPTVFAWVTDLSHPEHKGRGFATMFIGLEAGIGLGAIWGGLSFNNIINHLPLAFYSIGVLVFGMIAYLCLYSIKQHSQ